MVLHYQSPITMSRDTTMNVLSTKLQGLTNENIRVDYDHTLLGLSWRRAMANIYEAVRGLRWIQPEGDVKDELKSKKCIVVTKTIIFTADVVQVIHPEILSWIARQYGPRMHRVMEDGDPVTMFKIDDVFFKFGPEMGNFASRTTISPGNIPLTGRVILGRGRLYFETDTGTWTDIEEWADGSTRRGRDGGESWVQIPDHIQIKYVFGLPDDDTLPHTRRHSR